MQRKRTTAEWQALVDEFNKSGQTNKVFCAERGLNPGSFTFIRYKLAKDTRKESVEKVKKPMKLVPTTVRLPENGISTPNAHMELFLGAGMLRFKVGTNPDYVSSIVSTLLKSC